jgi:hypothetical protein
MLITVELFSRSVDIQQSSKTTLRGHWVSATIDTVVFLSATFIRSTLIVKYNNGFLLTFDYQAVNLGQVDLKGAPHLSFVFCY